jgi:HTH-type transcriptional regulator / antitoxin HipB
MIFSASTVSEIGSAIRARRREHGWDQATLAEKIGVSRLWVNQVERGKPGAGIGLVLRAFAALDLIPMLTTPGAPYRSDSAPPPVETPDIAAILAAARKKPSP